MTKTFEIDHDADADHVALDPDEFVTSEVSARERAAEQAFANYDFGAVEVESANGWERSEHGNEWSRVIFLATGEGEATQRAHFVVRFRDEVSAEIAEAYAINNDGQFL